MLANFLQQEGYERVDGQITLLAVNLFEQTECLSCSFDSLQGW